MIWLHFILLAVFAGYTASFVCVVLERRLEGRKPDGRSVCACGRQIPMYRNVPVISWLVQGGRAACCGLRIPLWYLGAEVATVATALVLAITPAHWLGGLLGIALAIGGLWHWHRSRFGASRPREIP